MTGVEEEKAFMESLIAKFADEKDELASKVHNFAFIFCFCQVSGILHSFLQYVDNIFFFYHFVFVPDTLLI